MVDRLDDCITRGLRWFASVCPKLDSAGFARRIMQVSQAIRFDEHVPERLTWKQICERYRDEWVVLVDTQRSNDTDFEFGTAIVLGHFTTRKEASPHIKAAFQHYHEVGSYWTGPLRNSTPLFDLP